VKNNRKVVLFVRAKGIGQLSVLPFQDFKEVLYGQTSYSSNVRKPFLNQVGNPYFETYNPGWRNHPNFGWRNEGSLIPQTFQPPPQPFHAPTHNTYQPPHKRSLEDTLQQYMQTQGGVNNQAYKFKENEEGIKTQVTNESLSEKEGEINEREVSEKGDDSRRIGVKVSDLEFNS
jgi:hypothetical protein